MTPETAIETPTTTTNEGERTLNEEAIINSLSDSDLMDEQVKSVSAALADSSLSDEQITAVTNALATDSLTDEQRQVITNAIATGNLSDDQFAVLGDALSDGSLTDEERSGLGFLNGADRTLDERAIGDSLADSGLDSTQAGGVSTALGTSDLSDDVITVNTDALAGDDLTDEQRRAVADAVAGGTLTDQQLRSLAAALNDGRLTDAERETLDFVGDNGVAYYQVDFVAGEPIENLRGPNGTYENDQLIRFAHGSTDEPITRRSEGEFVTDEKIADRIESHNITVANSTARTTFSVAEGESVTLTLASYEKVGPGWSPTTEAQQKFVDSETRTFESGTHTLSVGLPDGETNATD